MTDWNQVSLEGRWGFWACYQCGPRQSVWQDGDPPQEMSTPERLEPVNVLSYVAERTLQM